MNAKANKTEYVIFWLSEGFPRCELESDLTLALKYTEKLRRRAANGEAITFITMVGENVDRVGKDGVDEVKDGKTPDGVEYSWVKRR